MEAAQPLPRQWRSRWTCARSQRAQALLVRQDFSCLFAGITMTLLSRDLRAEWWLGRILRSHELCRTANDTTNSTNRSTLVMFL